MTGPYVASSTGQIDYIKLTRPLPIDAPGNAQSHVVHELRKDGETLCGTKPRIWNGQEQRLWRTKSGTVTCQACQRCHHEPVAKVCPTCGLQMPVTGVCGWCS